MEDFDGWHPVMESEGLYAAKMMVGWHWKTPSVEAVSRSETVRRESSLP